MKQIEVTPAILDMIRRSSGQDVAVSNLAVFEAIALNTLPVRKKHPLYEGAITTRGTLSAMASRLSQESVPVQIMHDSGVLPVGRVFHGEVIDTDMNSELRVLFMIDKTEDDIVQKIDNGVIDQVSVAVLAEKALCSECGFDYFGPDATFEHVFSGTDPEGHVLRENGVHVRLVGLDTWFEMSLVGRGGAQNARIVTRDQATFGSNFQRLAASGLDPNAMVLTATPRGTEKMDLKDLVEKLTANTVELTNATTKVTALEASVTEKDAMIADLTQKLAEAGEGVEALEAKDTEIADLKAVNDKALLALKDVATKILVATGDVAPTLPESVDELVATITDKSQSLAAALVAGGRSKDAIGDADTPRPHSANRGFRIAR